MKKSFAALLLLAGMAAFLSAPAFAYDETMSGDIANKLVNAQELQERRAGTKLRVSGTTDDTVYVGHSTAGAAQAPWYIYTGPYLPDQNDPSIAGNQDGYWGWDNFNAGLNDSLMGWWPIRRLYTITGGLMLADSDRPWWCFDAGNVVQTVVEMLNEYFSVLTDAAYQHEGTVFNMAGNSLLIGFNVPFPQPDALERHERPVETGQGSGAHRPGAEHRKQQDPERGQHRDEPEEREARQVAFRRNVVEDARQSGHG